MIFISPGEWEVLEIYISAFWVKFPAFFLLYPATQFLVLVFINQLIDYPINYIPPGIPSMLRDI